MKYLLFLFLRSGNEAKRLISVTQHAMPEEFGEKENGSVLTLGFQVPSYPAMCGIQRDAKKTYRYISI